MFSVEHIGIAVKDEKEAVERFTKLLGIPPYKEEVVEGEGVKTIFFQLPNLKIELLVALNEASPIAKFIEKRGEGIHHIAFRTASLSQVLSELKAKGFHVLYDPPKDGADQMQITFLHPKSTAGVLVEFCEPLQKNV